MNKIFNKMSKFSQNELIMMTLIFDEEKEVKKKRKM